MSEYIVLQDFDVHYDEAEMAERLRVRPGGGAEKRLKSLLPQAEALARPKAAVRFAQPEAIDEKHVRVGGVEFKSALLAKHLSGADHAFPYVATCGRELDEWAKGFSGLEQFMANEIMVVTVRRAVLAMENFLCRKFELAEISAMNPGSLPSEWAITEQTPLFNLMGDLPDQIGVRLLPSLLMDPGKSVSGIYFRTSEKFHNCQLCTKLDCPGRRSPYQGDGVGLGH